jgi:hypothetical protein
MRGAEVILALVGPPAQPARGRLNPHRRGPGRRLPETRFDQRRGGSAGDGIGYGESCPVLVIEVGPVVSWCFSRRR